ncbi:MAG: carbohydrate ABC transporter permease [Anaerolineae bacterium]
MRLEAIQGYLLISPWLVGFFIWTVGPMLFSAVMSFMDWQVLDAPKWAGLGNFERLLRDPVLAKSLYNTAYYTVFAVPLRLAAALAAALLLNQATRVMHLYRTFLYMPSVIPTVASVLMWVWIFNPTFGLANVLLRALGIPPQMWMLDANLVKPVFVFIDVVYVGTQMVLFLAALQGVPKSLKEAAMIDGANTGRQFWHVVIPMISPVILFNLIMGIISSFQVFTLAFLATNGGPNYASTFLVLYLYKNAFEFLRMGYACLQAWILFAAVLVLTITQLQLSRRWVYYEVDLVGGK